ncbi:MAG: hypothetical protein KC561_16245, partial [Myxococcales bacterium]|nr:hypothetical protein [Myxococcales bacterium]
MRRCTTLGLVAAALTLLGCGEDPVTGGPGQARLDTIESDTLGLDLTGSDGGVDESAGGLDLSSADTETDLATTDTGAEDLDPGQDLVADNSTSEDVGVGFDGSGGASDGGQVSDFSTTDLTSGEDFSVGEDLAVGEWDLAANDAFGADLGAGGDRCGREGEICLEPAVCISGACVSPVDPEDYWDDAEGHPWSYMYRLQFATNAEVTCGEDFDGDEQPDDSFGELLSLMGNFGFEAQDALDDQFRHREIVYITEWRNLDGEDAAGELKVFPASTAVQSWTTRATGDGSYTL